MPELIEGLFSVYDFTEEEKIQGMVLTDLQRKLVINERTLRAQQQILMPVDTMDPEQFKLDWHRSLGFMEALTWMLSCSETAKDELRKHLQEAKLEAEMASHVAAGQVS